jgi:predicted TIM-barrel fold metal-dependent hydrolase
LILQIQTEDDLLESIADVLIAEAGTLVIDHIGRPSPEKGTGQAGFRALLHLADRPLTAVKLSGPFRFSKTGYPYEDADEYAMAVLDAFSPERCVWGSDWPYVRMGHRVDYGPSLAALARWAPDPAVRRKILWTTPKRLFGFTDLA